MARRVRWAERAVAELDEAAEYIARDSRVYAAALVRRAHLAARSLSTLAERGRVVPEFDNPDLREVLVATYRLLYRITAESVFVIAFVHGARDLTALHELETRVRESEPKSSD